MKQNHSSSGTTHASKIYHKAWQISGGLQTNSPLHTHTQTLSNAAVLQRLTYTSQGWHPHRCIRLALFTFCLFYLSLIILPSSLPAGLSVRPCAVFNMLRGHMSTLNATEQIHYFVCFHSSFGPIRVLAFCYCHAWWAFLRCPPRGGSTFQRLSAEAHIHTPSYSISFRLTIFFSCFLFCTEHCVWKQRL